MEKYYKHEFRFNASHGSMGGSDLSHTHTFIVSIKTDFLDDATEKYMISVVNQFLNTFSGRFLDEMEYFGGVYPSVEIIGDLFYESLKLNLEGIGINLYEIGVADNPLAMYYVSDRILLPNLNDNISNKNYDLLTKLIERIE